MDGDWLSSMHYPWRVRTLFGGVGLYTAVHPIIWVPVGGTLITAGLVAGISFVLYQRRERRSRLRTKVYQAYEKLRAVCEPETLDPDHCGNQGFLKSDARDIANPLIPELEKARFIPPEPCTTEDDSLFQWFKFLETCGSSYDCA